MVSWFIVAIMTLAVFGYIAVAGVQTVATTSDASGRVETVRRLDAAAAGVLARAAPALGNGVVYLPVGVSNGSGQGYGLPSDLAAAGQTPFGQRFVYCPFGDAGNTGNALVVQSANSSSYSVASATFNGRDYVVGGRPVYAAANTNPNLLGFVMAPRTKLSPIPSCDQVIYNATTRRYEAPDAVVRAITRDGGVDEARTVNARQITFFVSPAGTGSGASRNDPASLETALAFFRSRPSSSVTIRFATGYYPITPASLQISGPAASDQRGTLTLTQVDGIANAVDLDMQNGGSFGAVQMQGELILRGVNFDSETVIQVANGSTLRMADSAVGVIRSTGGQVFMSGTNALTMGPPDNWAYIGTGGSLLSIVGTLNVPGGSRNGLLTRSGSQTSGQDATINFGVGAPNYTTGVYVDSGGRFACMNCRINFATQTAMGFYNLGDIDLFGGIIRFEGPMSTYGIGAYQGSRTRLQDVAFGTGTAPLWGIADQGRAAAVTGTGSTFYRNSSNPSSLCWIGNPPANIFEDTQPGVGGNLSSVYGDDPIPALSPSPTANEVRAYADARANNARRAVKRQANTSIWNCVG